MANASFRNSSEKVPLHYIFYQKQLIYDSTTFMDYICCTQVLPRTSQALCFITGVKAASFEILANLCINASSLYRWLGKGSSFFLLTWSHSLLVSLMIRHMWLETRQKFKLVYTISWVTFVIIQQISCVHTLCCFENSPEIPDYTYTKYSKYFKGLHIKTISQRSATCG